MRETTPHDGTAHHYVIVGGVAGGMSAATRLRRLDEHARITVIERGEHVSFANCGLPYYLGGVIDDREALLVQTPQAIKERFAIDVRTNTTAISINSAARTITVCSHVDGTEETLTYTSLILSPGANPVCPPIEGIEYAFTLRNVSDTDKLAHAITEAKTAVVVGGGFVGLEVAENLVRRGLDVTLIEAAPHVLAPLDEEMAALVHEHLTANGIHLMLNTSVSSLSHDSVTLSDGTTIPSSLTLMAVGVKPDITLAQQAGLTIGERGGIAVDSQLRTSDPHIYAVGDAVEKEDWLTGESLLVPLANTAQRQGRIVADIICGLEASDRPVLGTAIVDIFGLHAASTGWNERRLRQAGRAVRAIHTHPASHATYYPGAAPMHIKLLVDPDSDRILGAQVIGTDGVDKRIDVIATAIAGGLTAAQLADLELAYAPAFGSAKDPVNYLGYIDSNTHEHLTETVQWYEIEDLIAAGTTLIDVRTPHEFGKGSIPGAINIPLNDLRDRLGEIPDTPLVVSCAVGLRGHIATRLLKQYGKDVRNLDGGYSTWKSAQQAGLLGK